MDLGLQKPVFLKVIMAKVIKTIGGIEILITPKIVEFGCNPHNWESKMFPIAHIERVEVGYSQEQFGKNKFVGADLTIVTRSGTEKIFARDITLQQAKDAYSQIKSSMLADPKEHDTDTLYEVIYDIQHENEELKKKMNQLESLIGDLIEKTSVKSVPEGDLLG